MPIALNDHQLSMVTKAATLLPEAGRNDFLRSVAALLGERATRGGVLRKRVLPQQQQRVLRRRGCAPIVIEELDGPAVEAKDGAGGLEVGAHGWSEASRVSNDHAPLRTRFLSQRGD